MIALNQIEDFLAENSEIDEPLYSDEFNTIMTQEKLEEHLQEVKETLLKYNIPNAARKKCYAVIVEAMENVMRHGSKEANYNLVFHKFVVGKDGIELCFGNYVAQEDVPNLKKHLEVIDSQNNQHIKELMYTKAADGNALSDKGGAGIGIFDMAVKSKGKIHYTFLDLGARSYFLTMIKII